MNAQAPSGYDPHDYPPFAVTVDLVITTVVDDQFQIALIRRDADPYEGHWALPGGFVNATESAEDAAVRELVEETGLDLSEGGHLEQLRTYTNPDRDPRMRVVSVAYVAFIPYPGTLHAGTDARDAEWVPVGDALERPLAFDHLQIIRDGVDRVRSKLEYTTLATAFVPDTFTIAELRGVYEAVWGIELHPANFARKVLNSDGYVEDTGEVRTGGIGRHARLFRPGGSHSLAPPLIRATADT